MGRADKSWDDIVDSAARPEGRTSGIELMGTIGKKSTIVLAPEYDVATRHAARSVLRELGDSGHAVSWGVGGSQQIETVVVRIDGRQLVIEAETYTGLSIAGDEALVATVATRVADWLRASAGVVSTEGD